MCLFKQRAIYSIFGTLLKVFHVDSTCHLVNIIIENEIEIQYVSLVSIVSQYSSLLVYKGIFSNKT